MSEQEQNQTAQPEAAPQPQQAQANPPQMSPEQFETIKNALIQNFVKGYTQFIGSISHFPCAQIPMQEAFRHFDTGFLWFKESLVNMPVPQIQVMPVPQPQAASPEAAPQEAQSAPETAAPAAQEEVTPPAA
jgi:hypothetical protein